MFLLIINCPGGQILPRFYFTILTQISKISFPHITYSPFSPPFGFCFFVFYQRWCPQEESNPHLSLRRAAWHLPRTKFKMPLGGIEPPFEAPEASVLSVELQGQILVRGPLNYGDWHKFMGISPIIAKEYPLDKKIKGDIISIKID